MKWVYILQCEDDYYYIGETSRLYRRFWEHQDGIGGLNTSMYPPKNIIAIYSVNRIGKFFDYNKKVYNNDYNTNYNIYFDRGGIIENFNIDDEYSYDYDNLWVLEQSVFDKLL